MTPTCGAKGKRSGKPCQLYPCKNGRCHLHGGKSTGPRTQLGKERQAAAITKHGYYSKQAIEERRQIRELIKESREFLNCL